MQHSYFTQLPVIILVVGVLLAVGAVLGRLGRFVGVPAGLLFLAVGMLVGEGGPLGVPFYDYDLTYAVGTAALGLILFHGGLHTSVDTLKRAWKPAATLATVGVIGVTALTALGLWWVTDYPLMACLLIGAILGSTDAAAVFDLLAGQRLKGRTREIIEVESGLNDPMAYVLVVGFTQAIAYDQAPGIALLWSLIQQLAVGALVGLLSGYGWVYLLRIGARSGPGLYPVLTIAAAVTTLGLAMVLEGSGLLATYLAGIVMANRNIPYRPTVNRVYATLAWSSQIVMFFILGLLVTPSMLTANEGELLIGGTLLALWVAFVARPVVVGSILCLFRVPWRHNLLICWGGLRGAVPIILSTIPILAISQVRYANIQESPLPRLFTVVFMAVIVGAMVPGALVRPLTRLLGMDDGRVREPMVEIDFVAQKDIGHLYTTFLVPQNSPADGCTLRELALPQEASILMVLRGTEFIAPRGNVVIEAEDHVMVVYKPEMTNDITAMFAGKPPRARRPS